MIRNRMGTAWLLLVVGLTGAAADPPNEYADETLRVVLPRGWTLDGAGGEYLLESAGADLASLLLLAPDSERSLEARLADIEAQFVSTGLLRLDASEIRIEDGVPLHTRSYRLVPAGSGEGNETEGDPPLRLFQYSFDRAGVQVLLQIETTQGPWGAEDLIFRVFHTLEVRRMFDPFRWREGVPTDRS